MALGKSAQLVLDTSTGARTTAGDAGWGAVLGAAVDGLARSTLGAALCWGALRDSGALRGAATGGSGASGSG